MYKKYMINTMYRDISSPRKIKTANSLKIGKVSSINK